MWMLLLLICKKAKLYLQNIKWYQNDIKSQFHKMMQVDKITFIVLIVLSLCLSTYTHINTTGSSVKSVIFLGIRNYSNVQIYESNFPPGML